MLSKKSYYALKALLYLGKHDARPENPVLVKKLIEDTKLPKKFIESILVEIKQTGIINSKMGKGGGYYLSKSPETIYVGSVIRTLDGPLALIPCVSKMAYESCSHCRNEQTCSINRLFKEVRDQTAKILDGTSLKDLLEKETQLDILQSKGYHYVI